MPYHASEMVQLSMSDASAEWPHEYRRERYARAIWELNGDIDPKDRLLLHHPAVDAAMAVAEVENARLRERLRLLTDEKVASVVGPNIELLCGEIAQLRARVEDWKTAAGAGMRLTEELRAERDALAAGVPLICSDERHKTKVFALQVALARVEAVADDLDARGTRTMDSSMCAVAGLIRRALAGEAA